MLWMILKSGSSLMKKQSTGNKGDACTADNHACAAHGVS